MRTVLALLLGIASGLGAGRLLWHGSPEPERAARLAPPDAAPTVPEPSPEARTLLGKALAALPAPAPPPSGTARITGTVRTPVGKPVAGVVVTAYAFASPYKNEPPPATLEDRVIRFVALTRVGETVVASATSGEDGAYALTGLREEEYLLKCVGRGQVIYFEDRTDFTFLRAPGHANVTAFVACDLRLDVLLPDGSRPSYATLWAGADPVPSWSPGDPVIRWPPGSYELRVSAEGYADGTCVVELEPGRETVAVVRLGSQSAIRGTVGFARAVPAGYISVYALAFNGEEPTAAILLEDGAYDLVSRGSRDYAIAGKRGRHLVGVVAARNVLATRVVEVGDAPVRCDFAGIELDPRRFQRLSISTVDGGPVSEIEVGVGTLDADGNATVRSAGAFRAEDGDLLVLKPAAVEEDERVFIDLVSAYGRKRVFPDGRRRLPVRFAKSASVALTVARVPQGVRLATALTSAVEGEDLHDLGQEATLLDPDGRCEFKTVEAVAQTLVFFQKIDDDVFEAGRAEISLREGVNNVSVAAPPLYRLVVLAPGVKPGTMVEASPATTWRSVDLPLGADGRVTFPHLPAGRWKIDVGGRETRVQLPGPAEVLLESDVLNAIEVALTGAEDPLAKHGLLQGDLVVGIGDTLFENPDQMRALAGRAFAKGGDVSLLVERAGRRLRVAVPIPVVVEAVRRMRWTSR